MLPRLLLASLAHDRRRKLLAAGVVALGAFGASSLLQLVLSSRDDLARALQSYGANLRVTPAEGSEVFAVAELEALDRIFWRNNLVAIAPLYPLRVEMVPLGVAPRVATLVGTWFDRPLGARPMGLPRVRTALPVEGRWPQDGAAEVALGRRLAAASGLVTGDTVAVRLAGRQEALQVVGVVGGGGEEEDQLWASLEVAQRLADRPGVARAAEVFALTVPEEGNGPLDPSRLDAAAYDRWYCTAFPSAIAFQVDEALPGARAAVVREVAGQSSRLVGRLERGLLALAALVLIAGAVGVGATLTASVLGRRRELALLVALGGERRQVALLQLAETGALGAFGGLLGGALGMVAGRLAGTAWFGLAPASGVMLLPLCVAAGTVVALLGIAWPLLRSLRLPPAEVLRSGA